MLGWEGPADGGLAMLGSQQAAHGRLNMVTVLRVIHSQRDGRGVCFVVFVYGFFGAFQLLGFEV